METDGQLLERFLKAKDNQSFAEIMRRHGSLVSGVCQRVLGNSADADDAFQATFLVLLRKSSSMTAWNSIAGWLYQVALRTALNLRKTHAIEHQKREEHMRNENLVSAELDPVWDELRPVLDEELDKIPEKFRTPLILCYLEGKTYEVVAQELNIPYTTLKRRLDQAREALRKRLTKRGLGISSSALAVLVTQNASAQVSETAVSSVMHAASAFAAGASIGVGVSTQVITLMKSTIQSLLIQKFKTVAFTSTLVLLLAVGALAGTQFFKDTSPAPVPQKTPVTKKVEQTAPQNHQEAPKSKEVWGNIDPSVIHAKILNKDFTVHAEIAQVLMLTKEEEEKLNKVFKSARDEVENVTEKYAVVQSVTNRVINIPAFPEEAARIKNQISTAVETVIGNERVKSFKMPKSIQEMGVSGIQLQITTSLSGSQSNERKQYHQGISYQQIPKTKNSKNGGFSSSGPLELMSESDNKHIPKEIRFCEDIILKELTDRFEQYSGRSPATLPLPPKRERVSILGKTSENKDSYIGDKQAKKLKLTEDEQEKIDVLLEEAIQTAGKIASERATTTSEVAVALHIAPFPEEERQIKNKLDASIAQVIGMERATAFKQIAEKRINIRDTWDSRYPFQEFGSREHQIRVLVETQGDVVELDIEDSGNFSRSGDREIPFEVRLFERLFTRTFLQGVDLAKLKPKDQDPFHMSIDPELLKEREGAIASDLIYVQVIEGNLFRDSIRLHSQVVKALEISSEEQKEINGAFSVAVEAMGKLIAEKGVLKEEKATEVVFEIPKFVDEGKKIEEQLRLIIKNTLGRDRFAIYEKWSLNRYPYPFKRIGEEKVALTLKLTDKGQSVVSWTRNGFEARRDDPATFLYCHFLNKSGASGASLLGIGGVEQIYAKYLMEKLPKGFQEKLQLRMAESNLQPK
jgi:RNA polymerase sigma factor (sigma-70 family)